MIAVFGVALLVELVADHPDAPVHHVRGRDDVGAGLGVRDRGLGEQLERDVVVDRAVADEAAVAVRRVLAQADVGDHGQVGVRLLQRADRQLHDALVVVGAGAGLVLGGRDPEQDHRLDPDRQQLRRLGDELVDREAVDAGHRLDRLADVLAGDDEQRLDQVPRRQLGLANQVAEGLRSPQAPHARSGESSLRGILGTPECDARALRRRADHAFGIPRHEGGYQRQARLGEAAQRSRASSPYASDRGQVQQRQADRRPGGVQRRRSSRRAPDRTGNSARTTSITWKTPALTVPTGPARGRRSAARP